MREEATTVDMGSANLEGAADLDGAGGAALAPGDGRGPHVRLLHGMRRPDNWLQLIRFSIVGASGYAVNLAVYYLLAERLGIDYHVALAAAWVVAAGNNFVWNRHWTFKAREGQIHVQAIRFLLVSLVALGFNELVATLLIDGAGLSKVMGQVVALAASTPLNFLGNKLWSFRADLYSAEPSPPQEN
jgi:dolichol-phosphate mannosyltransferase